MTLFEYYTSKEAIDRATSFTISQPQKYYKLIDNIRRVDNLILKCKQELKTGPRYTAQIAEPPQSAKFSLQCVMLHGSEEGKLGDGKKSSFRKLIRSY